ncbi:alcohol dehydrogenase, NAD(P)-dependent [Rhodospirillaceae bacterium LM-1]|nr:alcohol dehydrogenase, NAD(P)-dependent [Rhodospirillaceae bacterium LM-1]
MTPFVYQNMVKILFGQGQIAQIAKEIPKGSRVLLAYGGGSIKTNGVYAQVTQALSKADHFFVEFAGIEPNPKFETLMRAVELSRSEKIDFILAVGGGSVADGCKLIAAAIPFEGDAWTILTKRAPIARAVPLGVVLTLPATGSEMNAYAVISRSSTGEKLAFGSPHVMPAFAVLDPETTFTLPARQIGNGIVDAFVHVLEQYLTFPAQAALQDRMAESVLSTLIDIAPSAMAEPAAYDARANLMWSATMALNGLIAVGVPQDWSTHLIGHELTALYGIDHARTLAGVWPGLIDVQRTAKREKLLQFAERVWAIKEGAESQRIDRAIACTCAFFNSVGVPAGLRSYDLAADTPKIVAQRLSDRGSLPLGERNDIDRNAVERILSLAMTV